MNAPLLTAYRMRHWPDRASKRLQSDQINMLSREHTCAAHCAEATDVWCAAEVWTCLQVIWCDAICLIAVHDPIHRLSVHQSEAAPLTSGLMGKLPQCTKQ